eukprot:2408092-Rhodomonas_salina.1
MCVRGVSERVGGCGCGREGAGTGVGLAGAGLAAELARLLHLQPCRCDLRPAPHTPLTSTLAHSDATSPEIDGVTQLFREGDN